MAVDFIFHAAPLVADNPGLEKNRDVCIIVMQKWGVDGRRGDLEPSQISMMEIFGKKTTAKNH